MSHRDLEPRLDKLEISDPEKLRALTHPVHHRIFRVLEENGASTTAELAEILEYNEDVMEEYLFGLVNIGLLDTCKQESGIYYIPMAKYYNISGKMFSDSEGVETLREMLIDRVGEVAQAMVNLGDDYVDRGRISFNQLILTEEDVMWARSRINDLINELSARSRKYLDEDCHSFRLALFFFPQAPAVRKKI